MKDYSEIFNIEDDDAWLDEPQEQPKPGVETDKHRLQQRQKQIDYGKNTIGYQKYIEAVPRDKRKKSKTGKVRDPATPDIYQKISKRGFDAQVKTWRRLLHVYDDTSAVDEPVAFTKMFNPAAPRDAEPVADRRASGDAIKSLPEEVVEGTTDTDVKEETSEVIDKAELACNLLNDIFGIKNPQPSRPKQDSSEKEQAKPVDNIVQRNKRPYEAFQTTNPCPKGINILEEILNEASNDSFMSLSRSQVSQPMSATKRRAVSLLDDVLMNDKSNDSLMSWARAPPPTEWPEELEEGEVTL